MLDICSSTYFHAQVFYVTHCNSDLEKLAHFFKKASLAVIKVALQHVTTIEYGLEVVVHKRTYKIQ
jgi:hypothetical protein